MRRTRVDLTIVVGLVALVFAVCAPAHASTGPGGGWTATPVAPILQPAPPPASQDGANYQENAQHDGVAPGPALDPTRLHLRWSKSLDDPGYPIIANGEVFITQTSHTSPTFQVLAFDGATGALRWKSQYYSGGGGSYHSLSYAAGRLFLVYLTGVVAFDAESGHVDWSYVENRIACEQMTGVSSTAHGYLVVPLTCEDTVGSFVAATGEPGQISAGPTVDMMESGPAITGDSVYVVSSCHNVRRYTLAGRLVWARDDGCYGSPSNTATVHGDQVWARDTLPTSQVGDVLSTHDGHLIGHFIGNAEPPAFDGSIAITRWLPASGVGALVALDASLHEIWRQTGDGEIGTPPLVSGHVVYVGTGHGNVFGYSTTTGKQVWHATAGVSNIAMDSGVFGVGGLMIGDGLLAVPHGDALFVYGQATGGTALARTPTPLRRADPGDGVGSARAPVAHRAGVPAVNMSRACRRGETTIRTEAELLTAVLDSVTVQLPWADLPYHVLAECPGVFLQRN